ncbi:MAG: hypothetical protein RBS99_18850, partial [Rhodospirillales bacterium]|nr:hypothetical protein [Rhodospirillales bacterium]
MTVRTSLTHPLEIAEVPAGPDMGAVGLTLCPGKTDATALTGAWARDLEVDLAAVADWGAAAVVTLMEAHELERLNVPRMGERVRRHQMEWFHLPIPDVSVPDAAFEARWLAAG